MISKLKLMMAFAFIFLASVIYAQVPQLFNYQGIARDAKGNPMGNQRIALKISVLPASDATSPEYQETQLVTTNEFGLYNLQIGNGQALSGEMKTVKWETGNKYIQVAIDPKGGNNFEVAGTSQLLSVPYALYADKAGSSHEKTRTGAVSSNAAHVAGDVNYLTKFTAYNTIGKSQLFDNGTSVGIGTATPGGRLHIYSNSNSVIDHVRMHNAHTTGAGRFIMYNDVPAAYATFTKYGSTYPGGYAGMASLYPYANLLAFGNNGPAQGDGNGRFLISTSGNVGISVYKGSSKLKFHVDYSTLNVAIGGNTVPMSRVHFSNTDSTYMDLRLTNNTSGHTANDGLVISEVGTAASIINAENNTLSLGTNNATQMTFTGAGNVGVGTTTPTAKLDVNGQVRIQGGTPGAGKVLTSDATGLATWQTPAGGGNISGSGTTDYIPMFTPNGTTLGNSNLRQTFDGLRFNQNNAYNRFYMNAPNGGYSGFLVIDSTTNQNGGYADSAAFLFKTPDNNILIGRDASNMLIGTLGKVQIGNGFNTSTGNAQLNVRNTTGNYLVGHFYNNSTSGDRTALIGIKSGNANGPSEWLMGVGGTGNGVGLTNNQFYIENFGKGPRLMIDTLGNVGIGTSLPTAKLTVNKTITVGNAVMNNVESGRLNFSEAIESYNDTMYCGFGFFHNGYTNELKLQSGCTAKEDVMTFQRDTRKVIIGNVASTPGNYKLYVKDGILTERLKVAVNGSGNWADYVFSDNYNLMPLEEVETFVKENKHLPNVLSAEALDKEGIDVAQMDAKLMEKIEELTLYMIEMKKEIKTLKAENETLKNHIKK